MLEIISAVTNTIHSIQLGYLQYFSVHIRDYTLSRPIQISLFFIALLQVTHLKMIVFIHMHALSIKSLHFLTLASMKNVMANDDIMSFKIILKSSWAEDHPVSFSQTMSKTESRLV